MFKVKIKIFLVIAIISFITGFLMLFFETSSVTGGLIGGIIGIPVLSIFFYIMGLHRKISPFFEKDYYEQQEEINFQKDLRREVERKRALSAVDNENLHYQNQLKIEYIAQVAQIQLQSNQYLANMYQQAIIDNSTKNEISAQKQLLEIETELKRQGLI